MPSGPWGLEAGDYVAIQQVAVEACLAVGHRQAEWKLLCSTHNLLKLWRTTTATTS